MYRDDATQLEMKKAAEVEYAAKSRAPIPYAIDEIYTLVVGAHDYLDELQTALASVMRYDDTPSANPEVKEAAASPMHSHLIDIHDSLQSLLRRLANTREMLTV